MARIEIELEVEKDEAGYRVLSAQRPAAQGLSSRILTGRAPGEYVARAGGELQTIRPLDRYRSLYAVFANLSPEPNAIAEFMSHFGPLTPSFNDDDGDSIAYVLNEIETMKSLLEAWQRDRPVFSHVAKDGIRVSGLSAVLRSDPATDEFTIAYVVNSLLSGLWLQFAYAVAQDRQLKVCRRCGSFFEAGPGTGRRADAEFCSDEHRVEFHSIGRSKRRQT